MYCCSQVTSGGNGRKVSYKELSSLKRITLEHVRRNAPGTEEFWSCSIHFLHHTGNICNKAHGVSLIAAIVIFSVDINCTRYGVSLGYLWLCS